MGKKKKHQKISPNFYGGGPRHGIFRFQRFKFSGEAIMHDARLASPRIPVIRFHISNAHGDATWRRDMGQWDKKKHSGGLNDPNLETFSYSNVFQTVHFQVQKLAVSFREIIGLPEFHGRKWPFQWSGARNVTFEGWNVTPLYNDRWSATLYGWEKNEIKHEKTPQIWGGGKSYQEMNSISGGQEIWDIFVLKKKQRNSA